MQLTANELTWETGSQGSNPCLSAKFCFAKFGEISPTKKCKTFFGEADPP